MKNKHLIVVSVDALVYEDLEYAKTLPSFGKLMSEGAIIERVKTIYPSLTERGNRYQIEESKQQQKPHAAPFFVQFFFHNSVLQIRFSRRGAEKRHSPDIKMISQRSGIVNRERGKNF